MNTAPDKSPRPTSDSNSPDNNAEKERNEFPVYPPEKDIEERSIIPIEEDQNDRQESEIKEPNKNNMKQRLLTILLLLFTALQYQNV